MKKGVIMKRGTDALKREEARSGADLCADAGSDGQAGYLRCFDNESKKTDESYLTYVRAIGALLRLDPPPDDGSKAVAPARRLEFDDAEDTWRRYLEQSCKAMTRQWDGDQAPVAYVDCKLKLTWNHMKELSYLYSDLWH